MPNPHYQRVLEQDAALPAPVRLFTRAMGSWWTIGLLAGCIVAYVAAAHIPLGSRYVWQFSFIDTTQHAMLGWWPLQAAALLLAVVVFWAATRRLPWRRENLGALLAVLGLSIILVSQSWAFRYQTLGVAAVPVSAPTGNAQNDALSLSYTTRMGDPTDRVLVVMAVGAAPIQIPLVGLPRWNDASAKQIPQLPLHINPQVADLIGYSNRLEPVAYLADGELAEQDGKQTATATPPTRRGKPLLPYPPNALLAVQFTTQLDDGGSATTTAWLPFEPEGTDSLIPKKFFQVEGLGTVGLAFRPVSQQMPFALAANASRSEEHLGTVHLAERDTTGTITEPAQFEFTADDEKFAYRTVASGKRAKNYQLDWYSNGQYSEKISLVMIQSGTNNPFIFAGLITFLLGVALDRLMDWLGTRAKPSPKPPVKPETDPA